MQLTFLGAARTVTGSRYLIEAGGRRMLVDCGLFQGYKELRLRNWAAVPGRPARRSTRSCSPTRTSTTPATCRCSRRPDSAARSTAPGRRATSARCCCPTAATSRRRRRAYANRHGYSKHAAGAAALHRGRGRRRALRAAAVRAVRHDAGAGGGHPRPLRARGAHPRRGVRSRSTAGRPPSLFSGDIGRPHDPVLKPPVAAAAADYLVVESTYGDRLHEPADPLERAGATSCAGPSSAAAS